MDLKLIRGLCAAAGQCESSINLSFGFSVHLQGRNESLAELCRILLSTSWAMGYNPINNDVDTAGDTFCFSCVSFTSQHLSVRVFFSVRASTIEKCKICSRSDEVLDFFNRMLTTGIYFSGYVSGSSFTSFNTLNFLKITQNTNVSRVGRLFSESWKNNINCRTNRGIHCRESYLNCPQMFHQNLLYKAFKNSRPEHFVSWSIYQISM